MWELSSIGIAIILKNALGFDFCNECMFPELDLVFIYSIVGAQCRIGLLMFMMSPSEPWTILDRHRFWRNAWLRVTGACFMLQKGSRHDVWRFIFFRTGMFSTFCKQPVVSSHHSRCDGVVSVPTTTHLHRFWKHKATNTFRERSCADVRARLHKVGRHRFL